MAGAQRLLGPLEDVVAAAQVEERVGVGRLQLRRRVEVVRRLAVPLALAQDPPSLEAIIGSMRRGDPIVLPPIAWWKCSGRCKSLGGSLCVCALRLRLSLIHI